MTKRGLIAMPQGLSAEIIRAAILGFEQQKRHIESKISELRATLSGGPSEPAVTPGPAKPKRRKISAAGRKAIAKAQRKRWAAAKKQAAPPASTEAPKPRLSAAGRRAIIAATKKRWAAVRAAKARAQKAASKGAIKKKSVVKKTVTKAPPVQAAKKQRPVKKAPAKKAAVKETAPVSAPATTESAAQ